MWSVYLLRDETGNLYTGITNDVQRRYLEHLEGGEKAAKYTRAKRQLILVYSCAIGDRSRASQIEYRLKRLPKQIKEEVVLENDGLPALLQRVGLTMWESEER